MTDLVPPPEDPESQLLWARESSREWTQDPEVPGGPRVGTDLGERPGDTQGARAGEPAAQPALPAGSRGQRWVPTADPRGPGSPRHRSGAGNPPHHRARPHGPGPARRQEPGRRGGRQRRLPRGGPGRRAAARAERPTPRRPRPSGRSPRRQARGHQERADGPSKRVRNAEHPRARRETAEAKIAAAPRDRQSGGTPAIEASLAAATAGPDAGHETAVAAHDGRGRRRASMPRAPPPRPSLAKPARSSRWAAAEPVVRGTDSTGQYLDRHRQRHGPRRLLSGRRTRPASSKTTTERPVEPGP